MQQNLSIETHNFGNAAKFANRGTATMIMQVNLPIDTAIEMQQNCIETLHYGDEQHLPIGTLHFGNAEKFANRVTTLWKYINQIFP